MNRGYVHLKRYWRFLEIKGCRWTARQDHLMTDKVNIYISKKLNYHQGICHVSSSYGLCGDGVPFRVCLRLGTRETVICYGVYVSLIPSYAF